MTAPQIRQLGLRLHLAARRWGAVNAAVALLALAAAFLLLWLMSSLQRDAATQDERNRQARHALTLLNTPITRQRVAMAPPVHTDGTNLAHFREVLGNARDVEQQIKTLFSVARKSGLVLARADYKLASERDGGFQTYQIVLPARGSYTSIQQFCENTLLAIPFASLDEIDFKRESVASPIVEAKLRLTLYVHETAIRQQGGAP